METEDKAASLFEIMAMLGSANDIEAFIEDLCTPQEIKAIKERWNVCQLLAAGHSTYRKISELTGASTTTITRVARFLKSGNGYKIALEKLRKRGTL